MNLKNRQNNYFYFTINICGGISFESPQLYSKRNDILYFYVYKRQGVQDVADVFDMKSHEVSHGNNLQLL